MADASEGFLLTRLIDALRVAEDCCRGIAIARSDQRWLKSARLIGDMNAMTKKMAEQSAHHALRVISGSVQ